MIHRPLAGARTHERGGGPRLAAALHREDLIEESQALGQRSLQPRQAGRLDRIVGRDGPQARQHRGHRPKGAVVGLEVARIVGDEIPALAELRIPRRAEQVVERVDHVVGVLHPPAVLRVPRGAAVPGRAHHGEDRHDHRESDLYLAREALGS